MVMNDEGDHVLEAVVTVSPPHSWIKRITTAFPSVVRVLDCRDLTGKEGVQELFEISSARPV